MKKRGISIRYKVLFLLTAIPAVTLTIYLFLALKIFTEDKIAYVFDSSGNVTAALASQIKTQLNSTINNSRPIFQDYLLQNRFSPLADAIFNNDDSLLSVISFKRNAQGQYLKNGVLEKSDELSDELLKPVWYELGALFIKMESGKRLVKNPFLDDRFYVFERIDDEKTQRSTIFLTVIRMGGSAEMFKENESNKIYLTDSDGKILLGPDDYVGKNLSNFFSESILDEQSMRFSQGVKELSSLDKSESLLVSYSKVGIGDLYVLSSVQKNSALSAVSVLIKKSVAFFGVLVSITIIISLFASNTLTSALSDLFVATKKVSEGDFNVHVNVDSSDEVGSLADNFNLMASEVSRLLDQTAEKARMQAELETAKTVQETLFPNSVAQIESLAISGFYEPASECGGDWWHYCQVGRKVYLWIGDATGHGAPAALITSAAKSAATIIERLNVGPGLALEMMNQSIYDVSKGKIMMTFFIAYYDLDTGLLTYANASHEAPFLIKKLEEDPKKKGLIPLNEEINPRLGQSRNTQYKECHIQVDLGDLIFFYTDGIPEVLNVKGDPWGEREFIKAILSANKGYPDVVSATHQFNEKLSAFRQGAPLVDDVTFFVIKRV